MCQDVILALQLLRTEQRLHSLMLSMRPRSKVHRAHQGMPSRDSTGSFPRSDQLLEEAYSTNKMMLKLKDDIWAKSLNSIQDLCLID